MDISNAQINSLITKISSSKARILSSFPFYGVLIMDTKFFLDKNEESFSTNGKDIFFNPSYLESLSSEELDISILHEVFHIIMKHPFRYNKGMANDLYHLASDIVVNSNIMKSNDRKDPLFIKGIELPHLAPNGKEGYLYTAEEVYEMLVKKCPEFAKQGSKLSQDENKNKLDETVIPDTLEKIIGPKNINQIFNFVPDMSGSIYFRELSFNKYEGDWKWAIPENYSCPKLSTNPLLFISNKLSQIEKQNHVRCRVVNGKNVLCYPDYITSFTPTFYDAQSIINDQKAIFDYYSAVTNEELITLLEKTSFNDSKIVKDELIYRKFVYKNYLDVSNLHKNFFIKFAKDNHIVGSAKDILISCRNVIATTAKYDLNFPKEKSNKDEVLLFLTETRKGVCYHFATALTLFLRSLGIPSRFVQGYLCSGVKDTECFAFLESGHGWVEAYLDGSGWVRLDPTPISGNNSNSSSGSDSGSGNNKVQRDIDKDNNINSFDTNKRWEEAQKLLEEMSEEEINARILKAYEVQEKHSNGCGKLPGFIESIISELRNPTINWKVVLHDFIQEDVYDYSFLIPDRRMQGGDIIMPSFSDKDASVKDVLFMIDCSGSMSTKDISDCFSEIKGAIDQFDGKLKGYVGFFDTIVYKVHEINEETDITKLKPVGRGGTCLASVFRYIKKNMGDNLPSTIIIMTDGYDDIPDESASLGIPTLWILNNNSNVPKWGRTIIIP